MHSLPALLGMRHRALRVASINGLGVRVLIVDDDHRLAATVRRGLEEAGFAADAVYDGEDAMSAALTVPYDVILLDVMLPKADGIEVSRRLRDRRMRAPILMLTARDSIDDRVIGLESGADDYLVKPFAIREVVARINALARRHLADRSSVLKAGSMALDTNAHKLNVKGESIDLTAKEYSILEYFMLNASRLLSRDQILEQGWSYDFEGGENLIDVYIGRLRRKIVRAGGADPFVTVRGSGYRFEPPQT